MKKINYKLLITFIIVALAFGGIGALLGGNMSTFENINKPSFSPPAIIFPIVWSILYILMGISSYLICINNTDLEHFKYKALTVYLIQLIINCLWTLFFFRLEWFLFAFIWLILLIIFVVIMFIKFYKISPLAGLLQIPYVIWLVFAGILNFAIYTLN